MSLSANDQTPGAHAAYFPALTGVRALAGYMVLLFHLNPLRGQVHQAVLVRWLDYFIQQLHVGLPIFFVLSGFLIAHRYQAHAEIRLTWFKTYLWNRFTRIYPLYFILTLFTFLTLQYFPNEAIAHWHAADVAWKDKLLTLLLNLTLTKAFFSAFLLSGIPTAWSLTVEESFYLFAPFFLLGLRQHPRRLLFYPALLLALGSLLVLVSALVPHHLYGFLASMNFMLRFTFFGRCSEFMCGIALALHWRTIYPFKAGWSTLLGGVGILFCTILLAIIKVHYSPTADWPTSQWSIVVQNVVLPGAITLFFYGLITERTWFSHVLSTAFFSLLGRSSYALYLLHLGVFDTLFDYYISGSLWLKLIVYSLVAFGLYTGIESPALRLLRRTASSLRNVGRSALLGKEQLRRPQ
ncbi:acyltransferase [Hymenobacter sp. NST-14]|uniref:acyltransferase family protein n=1 Tax=Hymenobacter piscis TaxID=2839984 RepID=UPI001C00AB61|nr:acyltransferase [Hymenobacter piscis]MBT9394165.1 acyltransferase [Hymenobacter piscis]